MPVSFPVTCALCAALALPAAAFSQNYGAQTDGQTNNQGYSSPSATQGKREAMRMVPAQAELKNKLDAKSMQPGYKFEAKLVKDVQLDNGPKLPSGTILSGTVEQDDMQKEGQSKLALRITQATLKTGQVVPVKATIVGIAKPESTGYDGYPVEAGKQMPNSWTDGTLSVEQVNVTSGVDLYSKISSRNSGVFVSKTKDNVSLGKGSEIELAIAKGQQRRDASMGDNNGYGGYNGGGLR